MKKLMEHPKKRVFFDHQHTPSIFHWTVSGFQSCHGRSKKRDRKTENKSYKQRGRERERERESVRK